MRVIIAGCRDFFDTQVVYDAVESGPFDVISEIVSGGASGVDSCGERIARQLEIPLKIFPADWSAHGKAAGPIRNREMAKYADGLFAVWDGKSRGTKNMIEEMLKLGKPVHIHRIRQEGI